MATDRWVPDSRASCVAGDVVAVRRPSSRTLLVNDSRQPLRQGSSGGMKDRPTRTPAQSAVVSQASSEPLSQRSTAGLAMRAGEAVRRSPVASDGTGDEPGRHPRCIRRRGHYLYGSTVDGGVGVARYRARRLDPLRGVEMRGRAASEPLGHFITVVRWCTAARRRSGHRSFGSGTREKQRHGGGNGIHPPAGSRVPRRDRTGKQRLLAYWFGSDGAGSVASSASTRVRSDERRSGGAIDVRSDRRRPTRQRTCTAVVG